MQSIICIMLLTVILGCTGRADKHFVTVRITEADARKVFLESVKSSGREYNELADGSIEVQAKDLADLKSATPSYEKWTDERVRLYNDHQN